jgi:hypothetical protein
MAFHQQWSWLNFEALHSEQCKPVVQGLDLSNIEIAKHFE